MDESTSMRPVRAQGILVGDCLRQLTGSIAPATQTCVVGKSESFQAGLYNPHTASGSIVVDGIAALIFTDTLPPSLVSTPWSRCLLAWSTEC